MIPYSYNMVDMGGIDLAELNHTIVPGIYEKIVEAMNLCGDLILYNWKFAGINIAPSASTVLQQASSILINGVIKVTENDEVVIEGLEPSLTLVDISVAENGIYLPSEYDADGFSQVEVAVPIPPIPPTPKYSEVTQDFFGLTGAFLSSSGAFVTSTSATNCLFLAKLHSNTKYILFLPEVYGNRYRTVFWSGKNYSDFEQYLQDQASSATIYNAGYVISNYDNPNYFNIRYYITGDEGELVVMTSNNSSVSKPVLLQVNS